jgi:hypothetical protein
MGLSENIKILLDEFAEFTKNEVRKSAREKGITFGGQDSRMLSDRNFVTKYTTTSTSLKLTIEIIPEYARVVDEGRSAGKTPPIEPIKNWIKRKGILKSERPSITKGTKKVKTNKPKPSFEKRLTSMAYAIAKNIGKNGTIKRFNYKGSNFWTDVVGRNGDNASAGMNEAYNQLKTNLFEELKKEVQIELISK